jgi:hypothetical protein
MSPGLLYALTRAALTAARRRLAVRRYRHPTRPPRHDQPNPIRIPPASI